jgi:hypothetical protein
MVMEKKKIRFVLISVALMLLLTLVAIDVVVAHPFTIKCPRDSEDMMFDHQVGYGKDAFCWYSHNVWDNNAGGMVKHEAYIACND